MGVLMIACGTHLGEGIAFAAPALTLPIALLGYAWRERRRERRGPRPAG
jgi:hypothetical protein